MRIWQTKKHIRNGRQNSIISEIYILFFIFFLMISYIFSKECTNLLLAVYTTLRKKYLHTLDWALKRNCNWHMQYGEKGLENKKVWAIALVLFSWFRLLVVNLQAKHWSASSGNILVIAENFHYNFPNKIFVINIMFIQTRQQNFGKVTMLRKMLKIRFNAWVHDE